jgi:transposase-like protein
MQIIFAFGQGVQYYRAAFEAGRVYEPEACPKCQGRDCLVRHGVYRRKPRDREKVYPIPIQRWLCKVCRETISALPDFVMRHRWYLVEEIEKVVSRREEEGASWEQMQAKESGLYLRTMQRWCRSFGGEASRWLGAVQRLLARQDVGSGWLDPQGEALRARNPAEALLAAAVHLLAWGKSRWAELGEYGWNDRLRFLGLWGSREGLGRLV